MHKEHKSPGEIMLPTEQQIDGLMSYADEVEAEQRRGLSINIDTRSITMEGLATLLRCSSKAAEKAPRFSRWLERLVKAECGRRDSEETDEPIELAQVKFDALSYGNAELAHTLSLVWAMHHTYSEPTAARVLYQVTLILMAAVRHRLVSAENQTNEG